MATQIPRLQTSLQPRRSAVFFMLCAVLLAACSSKAGAPVSANAAEGKCPVCFMNVKAADPWASEIIYSDGMKFLFESPGDLLTFYTNPGRFDVPESYKDTSRIQKMQVKEYRSRNPIDVRQASLVYKSRVKGPMGPDVVAFANRVDAENFAAENGGTVVTAGEITAEMMLDLRKK